MKDYNKDYYYMHAEGISFPAFDFIGPNRTGNMLKFFDKSAIDSQTIIPVGFNAPVPSDPKMADVHSMASNRVISQRIKEQLERLQLKNIQYIPVLIHNQYGEQVKSGKYYILHIHNLIRCVDTNKSEYTNNSKYSNNPAYEIGKLVLNNHLLDKIPLQERLVFGLLENNLERLYHRSVVEKIQSITPAGMVFYQLSTHHDCFGQA